MKTNAEIVFFYLYDSGRSIDLAGVSALIPESSATPGAGWHLARGRDTPQSLRLPVPLCVTLERLCFPEGKPFDELTMEARIFEEGVISMRVRVRGSFGITDMHRMRTAPFPRGGIETDIENMAENGFRALFARIRTAITLEPYNFDELIRETYTAFCVTAPVPDPETFVRENRRAVACLLNGEKPETDLHESQIQATLRGSFSYTAHDYTLLDLDRCLIIDPAEDYEDILDVLEQANFLLLELRSLDMLLDRWLDHAEDDIKISYKKNTARLKLLKTQLAGIHALAFDALFILENLENSSKIIGDYFLGQIFANLCGQFNTDGWTRSIERRLETLASVYERVNANAAERRMVSLEIMFIAVCVIFPLLQILQVFLVSR